jgi:two-component system CheB/CheR fusion protein
MLCAAARTLTGADGACIILREGDLVHYAHEDTIAPLWAGQSFPIGNCISGWSILHRAPITIPDIYCDERIPIVHYAATYVRSLAIQPIEPANPIGAIGIYWSRTHQATDTEMRLLERLANVGGITLTNARLREELHSVHDKARDFLAAVSHELRSSLNAILGWATFLRHKTLDESGMLRAIEVIERNARTQARLIEDLLDLSRITSGKLRLELHPLDINPVIRAAAEDVAPLAASKSIKLEVAAGMDACRCHGDGLRLEQVVSNLLSNAIKFTPEHGTITVTVVRTGSEAQISIVDTGVGIASEFLPHVFEPFRQANDMQAGRHGGLGLGLSIARDLVQMQGGTIEAYSAGLGHGAAFTVKLPLCAE